MTDIDRTGAGANAGTAKPTTGFAGRIRNYFLTGFVVAGPVAVTAYLIWWFVTWVDNLVRPLIPQGYRPETYLPVNIPGLRPDHRLCCTDAARLSYRQFCRQPAG